MLPLALQFALQNALGTDVLHSMSVSGGMIAQAARGETADGPIFVKWKADAPPRFFALEADGLQRLRQAGALRVPEVLAFHDQEDTEEATPSYLALEYIEERTPTDPALFARRFGEGLAALHRDTVSPFGMFGLETDNYIGDLPQQNTPAPLWSDFYRECRLLPQIALARRLHRLTPERERLVIQVAERLPDLLADLPSRPALLHGDLWSGNLLRAGNEPVVVDPSLHYGEREVELAFIELFGGFPPEALAAYKAAYPLEPGYARRRPLHQLYPLLTHLNHFGETYGPPLERACYALLL